MYTSEITLLTEPSTINFFQVSDALYDIYRLIQITTISVLSYNHVACLSVMLKWSKWNLQSSLLLFRTEQAFFQALNCFKHAFGNKNYAQTSYFFNSCPKLNRLLIWISGSSYCPNQCVSTACQAGCDPSCCTPTSSSHQMQYPSPVVYGQPEPIYPSQNPWQCPVACTRNVNFCPPYCSSNCCNSKRRSRVKIHKF